MKHARIIRAFILLCVKNRIDWNFMNNIFDLVVIGSGPGGYRAAVLAKLRGIEDVAIVEQAAWGGCCLNRGCVPKKAWHHTARLITSSQAAQARGVVGSLQGDLQAAWVHQREVVKGVRESYSDYLKRLGIATFQGAAHFIDAHTLAVGEVTLTARHAVIATGSSPFIPDAFPRTPGRILTTDDLFDAPPPAGRRVAILGSGVIGTEFAFILKQLGCDVVWMSNTAPLSHSAFSPAALSLLENALKPLNIPLYPRAQTVQVLPDGVMLQFADGRSEQVDWVLLGSGRRPHTDGLQLDAAGVNTDEQDFVITNDYRQTNVAHIFAIGDVANPRMTANHAMADADIAITNLLVPQSRASNPHAVPELVYSALEMGRIGLNEDMAIDEDLEPAVGFSAFETNPCALGQDDSAGFVRLIADMDSGSLLGAEVIGSEAGEIIYTIATQMGHDDALHRLAHLGVNHPARAEEIRNATETLAVKWGLSAQVFCD